MPSGKKSNKRSYAGGRADTKPIVVTQADLDDAERTDDQEPRVAPFVATPSNGEQPIGWVPIHESALSDRMAQTPTITYGEGPYDIVFLPLTSPDACKMADRDLWPAQHRQCMETQRMPCSQFLRERLHFGAMVNSRWYAHWRDERIEDAQERAQIVSWVEQNNNMLAHNKHSHVEDAQPLDPDKQSDVAQAREEAAAQERERLGKKWLRFHRRNCDSPCFLLRVVAHHAGLASYYKRLFTTAPELEQLKQRRGIFHPHVPQSFFGYMQSARQAWTMGSLHQACAPFDIAELDRHLAASVEHGDTRPSLAVVHFEEQKEL